MITKFISGAAAFTGRSWWPASEMERQFANPNSDVSLAPPSPDSAFLIKAWSHPPGLGVAILRPDQVPSSNAGPITIFPRGLLSPAALSAYAGPPPPPRGAMEWVGAAGTEASGTPGASTSSTGTRATGRGALCVPNDKNRVELEGQLHQ